MDQSRRPFHVIHNSCDFDAYDLAEPPGEYLAFLGRMGAHKNPVDAIRIARAAGLPAVLAGRPQTQEEERYFAECVFSAHRRDRASSTSGRSTTHRERAGSSGRPPPFCSRPVGAEPFKVVMVEAMASGLPVLAYPNGSVPEVIDYGVTGYYAGSVQTLVPLVPKALALDRVTVASTRAGDSAHIPHGGRVRGRVSRRVGCLAVLVPVR